MNENIENINNPLDDENNENEENKEFKFEDHLIYGRQKKWKKVIEWILTILGWIIILTFVLYYIYGSIMLKKGKKPFEFFYLNRRMLRELNHYCFIALIAFLILVVLLIIWKNYNYYRFGKLNRRKFKPDVNVEELSEFFEIDKDYIEKMQNERYVLLEENIIPAEMGMGGKDKKKSDKKETVKV